MIGKILNHFKILDRLGKGGMGEVYVAEDCKLKRKVALKVLPEDVARDPARLERFQREAESIAALNHPNIVTIYSIEETDGVPFLTMELVEGETLIQLIPSNGLDVESFLRFGAPVAEALSAAHEKGIIHRDLKPANIMVNQEGRVKVLDFGLAKLMRDDSDPDSSRMETHAQTEAGIVLGTMPYMSPEQIQGKKLDQRSDIFSLGIIFYEMITGRRPFHGDTSAELISSIMRDTPIPVSDMKADTPEHLERIIRRCLTKDPRDRYQTARDVYNELRDLNSTSGPSTRPASTSTSGEMWIAVLPFQYPASDPEMENFADGLAQDITAALSQFSYLSVMNSALRLKGQSYDVRTASTQLGARYLLQGGIRKSGSLVRINLQLMDAHSGTNLWAETYNRDLNSSDIFSIQDEITDRVAATLADNFGVLVRSMVASLEDKPDDQLSANEFIFRFFGFFATLTPEKHAQIRSALEKAVERIPKNADLWGCLSIVYGNESYNRLNELPNSLDRCLMAAKRAVELSRTSQIAQEALAWAHFLRRDLAAVPAAIDRAISLNPRNSNTLATLGGVLIHTAQFERGAKLVHRAMELNPHHADWFHFPLIWDHCSRGEYEQMLERVKRINIPGIWWVPLIIASACGHLNRKSEAAAALKDLLAIDPEFAAHARDSMGPLLSSSGLIDTLIDGLQKAGLQMTGESAARDAHNEPDLNSGSFTRTVSSEMWIAVLPFKNPGKDAELEALSDGLTEEVILGLSRFSYLHVIGGHTTSIYKDKNLDIRAIGKEIGAHYLLEGTIRKLGSSLRFSVQLLDTTTGAHLWNETYKKELSGAGLFELQEEIASRIASTVGGTSGALIRSMAALIRSKPAETLTPYEAVVRGHAYLQIVTPEEHKEVRACLQRAVESAPDYADAWAALAQIYSAEFSHGFNVQPDPLDRALAASRKAIELDATNQQGFGALALVSFFRRDFGTFRTTAERAIRLNPLNGDMVAYMGTLTAYSGDWERGVEIASRAMALNPDHPGWYHFVSLFHAYRSGNYDQALEIAERINMPSNFYSHMTLAAIYARLGKMNAARDSIKDLLATTPDFGMRVRSEMEKWHGVRDPDLVEKLVEDLRKAGLNIPDAVETDLPAVTADHQQQGADSDAVRAQPNAMWIAVLPFQHPAADSEMENFTDGLAQDITAALSQFSYLSVIAQDSSERQKARYVIQGGIRKSGSLIRVNVQLIDKPTGTNLWAETYNRDLKSSDIFTIQDEITDRVAATLADNSGVLVRSMVASLEDKPDDQLSGNEFVFRFFGYWTKLTPEKHAEIRSALEKAVERIPRNADLWGCLSLVYYHEFAFGFNELPNSLDRCLMAAQRAVELNRTSQLAYEALMWAQFFRRDVGALPATVERAISLNPRNSHMLAVAGLVLVHTRNFDRGATVARRAMELNPHHAGWFHFSLIWDHYSRGEYDQSLEQAKRVNMPGFFWPPLVIASVCGELGRKAEAASAVNELLAIDPEFALHARRYIEPWHYASGLMDQLLDGLRKAGLEVADEEGRVETSQVHHTSGERRADEGFWVAVLPFKCTGGKAELTMLADGMTDEIVTGLSHFSYLRVIARSSTLRYADTAVDARIVGKEIGARYIMQGSLRQSGSMLRLAVQLVDASTGAHLWAETYDRTFSQETIFELQDELVPRIVSTIADMNGVLPQSMSEAIRSRNPDQLSPYEAVLRSFAYFQRVTAEELAAATSALKLAVRKEPDYADAWALLALLRAQDYGQAFNLLDDPLKEAITAAHRAVETGPSNHLAHFSLAQVLYFQKEFERFRNAAERAAALNPMDGNSIAFLGELLIYSGDFERGLALAGRAKQLNPNHPGWYWYADFYNAYRQRDYRSALGYVLKANLPGHWGFHAAMAAAYGQLGQKSAGAKALQELLVMRPEFAATARKDAERWWEPEYVEHLIVGWRKAGLKIR